MRIVLYLYLAISPLFPNVVLNEIEFENTIRFDYRDFQEGSNVEKIDRRRILCTTAAGRAGRFLWPGLVYDNGLEKVKKKTPVLHVTDLFRPHINLFRAIKPGCTKFTNMFIINHSTILSGRPVILRVFC